ncbi:FixH family protein [Massilia sp. PAMC28688]|uniref:FixH family protein n=1 Tax=Massilia sp. PAMC28688 TaxID=2861283 RepID=UPI001C62D6B1|nr:FixH family protein [Massilia sp. PAMC28688]QYF92703.1 FixH family protein [Massilia sp. PAMC28688]
MQTQFPSLPWYRHRWPWLLMLGPFIIVIAGVITGVLAWQRQDAMVVDDYYKRGKTINLDLRRDDAALARRLAINWHYDAGKGVLTGRLSAAGEAVRAPFRIHLAHSTQPSKDLTLDVFPNADGKFTVALPALVQARWQVTVEGGAREWRLRSQWLYPARAEVRITAVPQPG